MESKKTLAGRSFCPKCDHQLSWLDLVPVFSFCFLGGKCRYCNKKISWQYPAVELATAIIFLLILNKFSIWQFFSLAFWFYIVSVLIVIFVYDLKHYLIPDKVLFPAIGIAVAYLLVFDFTNFWNGVWGAAIGCGFFLLIFLVSQGKWMGFGDVKLAILLGLLLGISKTLVALFLAFCFGAIIGIITIALHKKDLKSEIPFGPFLIFGTFVALFWGDKIINWYLSWVIF